MANPDHVKWLLEGVKAWNARREREYFRPDLWEADLSAADLREADLERADLRGAILLMANLRGANLRGANLEGANLRGANLEGANLEGANLEGANLEGANLEGADLRGAILLRADLRGAILLRANLRGANLEGANLRVAILLRVNLEGANLRGANLRGANLRVANLEGANLRGAILEGADLRGAILLRANVKSVHFSTDTNDAGVLKCTDLLSTLGLTQKQLNTMDGDTGVILPKGLHHPAHWPDPEVLEESNPVTPTIPELSTPETLLLSITAPIDVQWTAEGYLQVERAELIAVEPEPKRALPYVSPSAQMEQLAGVGALAAQIRASISANASPNAAPILGEIGGIFEAIEREVHKPKGQVLIVLVRANIRALQALSSNKEALSIVDRALFDAFMAEAQTLLKLYPILQEIEDPHQSELVPTEKEADALSATEHLIEVLESPETVKAIGPSLPGVTRDLAAYPWDSDRKKIAVFAAIGARVKKALESPPPTVTGGAQWATIIAAVVALLALLTAK